MGCKLWVLEMRFFQWNNITVENNIEQKLLTEEFSSYSS